uniref:Uncharacterized protein n=1 Tax=Lygus hesperus TaxID=30085 RepID=A0A146LN93_LYGHE
MHRCTDSNVASAAAVVISQLQTRSQIVLMYRNRYMHYYSTLYRLLSCYCMWYSFYNSSTVSSTGSSAVSTIVQKSSYSTGMMRTSSEAISFAGTLSPLSALINLSTTSSRSLRAFSNSFSTPVCTVGIARGCIDIYCT